MGYEVSFLPNEEYGAAEINKRLSNYVTGGVADPFTNGVPWNNGLLNDLTAPLTERGVVPESDTTCKCFINATEKTITILKGVCFFNNGTSIEIDSAGVVLPYTTGVKNYVYVKSDLATSDTSPHCTTTEPIGDYVMLAEISNTGALADKRVYAKGKLPGYQSDFNRSMKFRVTRSSGVATTTHTLDGVNYKHFVFTGEHFNGMYSNGIYSSTYSSSRDNGNHFTDGIYPHYKRFYGSVWFTVSVTGAILTLSYQQTRSEDVEFDVYAF